MPDEQSRNHEEDRTGGGCDPEDGKLEMQKRSAEVHSQAPERAQEEGGYGMSDDMIRGILIERKRQERRKQQNKELIREIAEGALGWGSLFFLGFMLSVIGG